MSVISVRGQFLNREVDANRERRRRPPADTSSDTSGNGTPGGSRDIPPGKHAGNVRHGDARGSKRERETLHSLWSVSVLSSRKFVRPAVRLFVHSLAQPSRRVYPSNPGRTSRGNVFETDDELVDRVSATPFRARQANPRPLRRSPIAARPRVHARSNIGRAAKLSPTRRRIPIS